MSAFSLTFLTRSGCHLCASARPQVERLAVESGLVLVVRDIDADEALSAEYTARVPVVLGPSGRVLAEGVFDQGSLREELAAELRGSAT